MDINKHIQTLINQIKVEEQKEIAVVKEKAMREKIIPFNQEIDRMKNESIVKLQGSIQEQKDQLTASYNEQVSILQKKFEEEKAIINETANKKKSDNESAVLATETYEITSKSEKAISKLTSMIETKE